MAGQNRRAVAFFLSGLLCLSSLLYTQRPAQAAALPAEQLVPVGHTIGIKLFAEGVVVIGLAEVDTGSAVLTPGADCGLQVGDVIEEANGKGVESSEHFAALLQCGGVVELAVTRGEQELTLSAEPVQGADGTWRLGAWIRDSMAGIGTVTFYDPSTGTFGALGHGITDLDTGLLMPLGDGAVMNSSVKAVKRGAVGEPGELKGNFDLQHDLGELYANTERGVFGTMDKCELVSGEALPVASVDEVHTGSATILSNVSGDGVEEYAVEIVRVLDTSNVQNLLIQVTDSRLIEQTGGIVQGMSGSPIIQDGKFVGAVTHVMVNEPTKGYGILIENMLAEAGR
ncbi:MAG: SpoIVB peptidase [Oscillospiraceae bacterium]|jgi:stage IV sporulation protein B|nr:SpoIVB peptidase [Oscillospiraceae bacterium]